MLVQLAEVVASNARSRCGWVTQSLRLCGKQTHRIHLGKSGLASSHISAANRTVGLIPLILDVYVVVDAGRNPVCLHFSRFSWMLINSWFRQGLLR